MSFFCQLCWNYVTFKTVVLWKRTEQNIVKPKNVLAPQSIFKLGSNIKTREYCETSVKCT